MSKINIRLFFIFVQSKAKGNMKYKTIPLLPTHFSLDVLITSSDFKAKDFISKQYDIPFQELCDEEGSWLDSVTTFQTGEKAKIEDGEIILLCLSKFNLETIVHELIHVLHHTSDVSKIDLSYTSQEWQALFVEQVFKQIMDKKTYKTIK